MIGVREVELVNIGVEKRKSLTVDLLVAAEDGGVDVKSCRAALRSAEEGERMIRLGTEKSRIYLASELLR